MAEGRGERERKKEKDGGGLLGFPWVDGYCATLKVSKTKQVHLTPSRPSRGRSSSREAELASLGTHIFLGGEIERCLHSPTALQGEIKSRESFSGPL